MWFGKSFDDETNSMTPEGSEIEKQQSTRDMRVNMSSCGGFDEHIQRVTSKGEQIAGWILRIFHTAVLKCAIPVINSRAPSSMRTLKESTFAVHGPRLLNILPCSLRNFQSDLQTFKSHLDRLQGTISDQPSLPGYYQVVSRNSLIYRTV